MGRKELVQKLESLGWSQANSSGRNHTVWTHPTKPGRLVVPNYDIIFDSTAARLLDEAER